MSRRRAPEEVTGTAGHALAALRRSVADGDLSPWAPHALAALFGSGGVLVSVSCALPGRTAPQLALAASAAALLTALALTLLADHVGERNLHVLLGLGSLLISLVVVSAGDPASADVLMYVWVGLFAAFFFSPRALLAHLALAFALYAGAVAVVVSASMRWSPQMAQRALVAVGVIAVASAWTLLLRTLVATSLERQRHGARTDALTSLANRAELLRAGTALLASGDARVAVLLIDLDDFKEVNDALGHHAGDELLRRVARRLRRAAAGSAVIARLGGDEFAVLLGGPDAAGAPELARTLVDALSVPHDLEGEQAVTEVSIGVAHARGQDDLELVLRDADLAMYAAKDGGGQWRAFDPGMQQQADDRHALRRDLRSALRRDDELVVHLQPVVDLATGLAIGAEALVRWQHPARGLLAPDRFIPLAERSGLIVELGAHVLDLALGHASAWPGNEVLAVNLSAAELHDAGLIGRVREALARHAFDPGRLVLEITETAIITDPATALEHALQLRELGASIAIDDFGTGHASLSHLSDLPVRALKLPRPFVRALGRSQRDDDLARGIIALADRLDLDVVAEGIETPEQLEALVGMGASHAQGYLLGRPTAAADLRLDGRFVPPPTSRPDRSVGPTAAPPLPAA